MSDDKQTPSLEDLAGTSRFAMFTTTDAEGRLVSRPMAVQEYADGVFRFITQAANDVARDSDGKQVNLTLVDSTTWVSVSGTGAINTSVELKQRLWNVSNDTYTTGGPENPDNIVLEVDPGTVSYWDSPNAAVQLLDMIKAKVTGTMPTAGEHGTIEA